MTPALASACAMAIEQFRFTEMQVQQSSPFPCDNNTISVAFKTNVPVYKSCHPKLTLSGFAGGVVWPPAGNMALNDVGGSGSVGSSIGFGETGEWGGPSAGVLKMLDLFTNFEADTFYRISFVVTNPRTSQSAQSISYNFAMTSSGSPDLDSMNVGPILLIAG